MRDARVESYLTTIVATQFRPSATPLVRDVLVRIERAGPMSVAQALRILALRKYLRIQNQRHRDLAALWALSGDEMNRNIRTEPGEDGVATLGWQLMQEAARVQREFAAANPGYSLAVSRPRDLDRQVRLWNGNLAVRATATELLGATVKELDKPQYDLPALLPTVEAFARWLQEFRVTNEPGNAAPGTSDHGQLRAVDFVIMKGQAVVAGTTRATIPTEWTASGWGRRLAAAATTSRLVGPLAHPYEPWHWALP